MPKNTKQTSTRRLLTGLSTLLQEKMRWRYFRIFVPATLVVVIALLGLKSHLHTREVEAEQAVRESQQAKRAAASSRKKVVARKKAATAAKPVDWHQPSENKPYPKLSEHPNMWIDADLGRQRVYLRDGKKVLYTMYASSGMNNATPTGEFTVESERGTHFYNPQEKMGANYYTSFHQHGVFLFHTVPTDVNGKYIKSEADLLGKRPSSHGCIRLTIPDAKWIFDTIPIGTRVKVHD